MSAAADHAPPPRGASRTLAMMTHLSTCVAFIVSVPVAAGLIGPMVAWAYAHGRDPFLLRAAREALNFHLTVLLGALAMIALPTPPTVVAVLVVIWIALVVIVAGLAYEGRPARYPVAVPILRTRRLRRG